MNIEDRLNRDGEQFRHDQPSVPSDVVSRALARRHRVPAGWLVGAAAAAVLAVIAGAGLALRDTTHGVRLSGESPSPQPSTPASPSAVAITFCSADQVTARTEPRDSAAGHRYHAVVFTATSPCALSGYPPSVRAVRADGSDPVTAELGTYVTGDGPGAFLEPGDSAEIVVETTTACLGVTPPPAYPRLLVEMPGGGTVAVADENQVACSLRVSEFGVPRQ